MKIRTLVTLSVVLAGCHATLATGPASPPPPAPPPPEVRDHREPTPPPPAPPPPHEAPPPAPPAPPPVVEFNHEGWTLIGSTTVDGKHDHDMIKVGMVGKGTFRKATMVVLDSDMKLDSITFKFGNGTTFSPPLQHMFHEGQRTRALDLPGDKRFITNIDLKYSNIPGEGRARVEIWAK